MSPDLRKLESGAPHVKHDDGLRFQGEKISMRMLASGLKYMCAAACLVAFPFMAVPGSHAQQPEAQAAHSGAKDLAGAWQGTLQAGKDLRTVVKITKSDTGGYKAVFYSIDQGGRPIPVDSTTLDGSTVKMSLKMIGGAFEGKLSGDGNTIDGSWSQGQSLPLVLTRATPATEWTIPPPPPVIPPMAKDANPSFEVATIKPSQPDRPGRAFIWCGVRSRTTPALLYCPASTGLNSSPGTMRQAGLELTTRPSKSPTLTRKKSGLR